MNPTTLITISEAQWAELMATQKEILEYLKKKILTPVISTTRPSFITTKEFMEAVRIKLTKFDQLVHDSKIKIIKKKRKIYLAAEEIDRYFTDRSIQ